MKKNDKITVVVKTPFATTEEEKFITKITTTKIFVDGLDNPFNRKTGYKETPFGGCSVYIKEIVNVNK